MADYPVTPHTPALSEQEIIRRQKLQSLIDAGQNPYAVTHFDVTHHSKEITDNFESLEGKTVSLAGRMVSRRVMGKASFAHLLDAQGEMQIYVTRDDLGEDAYAAFKKDDLGDIIGVSGTVFCTKTGEASIHVKSLTLLCKSLKVLPEKFHGLVDTDLRYRQRYVDCIVNPEVRDTFRKRSRIIAAVREFLDGRGYLEVDTPVLHTVEIGASARPFRTFHNALGIPMFLRIETELYLKRLIVGGFERVYEVGRIFRNEGMDATHNPEFTSVETYQAYADYNEIMEMVEQLYEFVALKTLGTTDVTYQGQVIHLKAPWKRITMADSVKEACGEDWTTWQSDEEARAICDKRNVHVEKDATKGDCLAALFDEYVEANLIQPTFITDYPVEISPLAKRKPSNPALTERFEFFITGHEMGNAFTELNDPIDQRRRFEAQVEARKAQGEVEMSAKYGRIYTLTEFLTGTPKAAVELARLLTDWPAQYRPGSTFVDAVGNDIPVSSVKSLASADFENTPSLSMQIQGICPYGWHVANVQDFYDMLCAAAAAKGVTPNPLSAMIGKWSVPDVLRSAEGWSAAPTRHAAADAFGFDFFPQGRRLFKSGYQYYASRGEMFICHPGGLSSGVYQCWRINALTNNAADLTVSTTYNIGDCSASFRCVKNYENF